MHQAIIRADGSKRLGLGHIMRCLALAKELKKADVTPIFVIRNYDRAVKRKIEQSQCITKMIPASSSIKEDLLRTSKAVNQHNANIIITDLCNTDMLSKIDDYKNYLKGLKNLGRILVTIDDLNSFDFPSDIMINPSIFAEKLRYKTKDSKCKYLLGPKYFIFRSEFIKPRKRARLIRKHANRVLVSMGGSDLQNLTIKVVRALSKIENLNVKIVAGPAYDNIPDLKHIVSELKNYEIIVSPENMAELMLWSDVAVIAGGLTKYELAVTGTPGIAIAQAEHQIKLCRDFEKMGVIKYLGFGRKVKESLITNNVKKLLSDTDKRKAMSEKCKKSVDGKGAERVVKEIKEKFLSHL